MFHGNDGALILPEKTVRTRGWTPGSKLVAGPASGLVRCRVVLKKEQFDKEWWSAHVEQVALAKKMCEAHEANIRRHGCRPAEYVPVRQEGRLSRRRQANIDHKARVDALRIAADKVQVEFEETFSWEERKLIVAQAYFTERLALAEETGVISCSRRVMMAYLICAAKGETATADRLQLWERAHKKHRDLHLGELASLQQQAGLTVAEVDARMAAKIKTTQDMKAKLAPMIAKFKKQLTWTKRRTYNKRPGSDPVKKKFDAKARVKQWQARVAAGDVHRDRGRVRARRKI